MNKLMKVMSILLMLVAIVMILSTPSMAFSAESVLNSISPTEVNNTELTNMGNTVIGLITTIGVFIAVIVILILGIKYMVGSASEKAEYKKTMIPYLVGAVLIFSASAIVKLIVTLATF